jgi:hypothetical protein
MTLGKKYVESSAYCCGHARAATRNSYVSEEIDNREADPLICECNSPSTRSTTTILFKALWNLRSRIAYEF